MKYKIASSCCSIVDRKDHVQYLQFQRAIPDDCTCSLTEQNSDKRSYLSIYRAI